MEPRYNETLYNEVLRITNDFLYPSHSKIYEKKPRYSEHILPVSWPFVNSRFHCSIYIFLTGQVLVLNGLDHAPTRDASTPVQKVEKKQLHDMSEIME